MVAVTRVEGSGQFVLVRTELVPAFHVCDVLDRVDDRHHSLVGARVRHLARAPDHLRDRRRRLLELDDPEHCVLVHQPTRESHGPGLHAVHRLGPPLLLVLLRLAREGLKERARGILWRHEGDCGRVEGLVLDLPLAPHARHLVELQCTRHRAALMVDHTRRGHRVLGRLAFHVVATVGAGPSAAHRTLNPPPWRVPGSIHVHFAWRAAES
mmetsp:Transcript_4869/g.12077  ORF Transcript_4869/g.12077 Transcript_4869/m.12077 type:complete len:211 (+) Transcript_4869:1111-1743(+)